MAVTTPRLVVFSSLFPSAVQPNAGLFIRERMFRVGKHLPIVVVAPQPWFPGQQLIRWFRPHFRPMALKREMMDGIVVHRPRFFCIPGILKWTDGLFMALSSFFVVRRIARDHHANIIDAHFGYPTGYAAVLLGRWLHCRSCSRCAARRSVKRALPLPLRLNEPLQAPINSLPCRPPCKRLPSNKVSNPARVQVIGNGVDLTRFMAVPRLDARRQLGLPADAEVLVSVGTLVERKGFHRVIECLPGLLAVHPMLHFVIVGGAGPEGDMGAELKSLVRALGLDDRVHFLGPLPNDRLKVALSAADVFVLATSYEGWANVFLEAMACGLPVVTTDVGGNAQVVNNRSLGRIVPFGDTRRLQEAIDEALRTPWDRQLIRAYAESNSWDRRIKPLVDAYHQLLSRGRNEHAQALAETGNAG